MLKPQQKILISTFLTIFILQMIGLIVLLSVPNLTQAAEAPKLQIDIGANLKNITPDKEGNLSIDWTGKYIQAIYKYAIGVVGILAAVVLMVGGIIWLTAGGNQTRIGEAKAWIGASLTGLIIALTSYMILWTVNPALVQFRPIGVATVSDNNATGCCEKEEKNIGPLSQAACENKNGKWGGKDSVWDNEEKQCGTISYLDTYSIKCLDYPAEICPNYWLTTGFNTIGDSTYCGDILLDPNDKCSLTWICCQCIYNEYCGK